ncbi:hypothetical protein [Actinopolymorpha pittospori]|uniref:Uncharacterized protein n=1 Tax=Actinopolymorpha pittospori TaxID=648752 RepID=A0A927NB71_9ACTN|nr:hypothetical protein [Actinopolymorpha pittospori]MBE1611635.1 hypothetical protein [Actinopolymorpha pittospori]
MRDVQKGRKSWLERLTSPPESEADDQYQDEPHPFEQRALDPGPRAPLHQPQPQTQHQAPHQHGQPPQQPPMRDARDREPGLPEGFEAFAPPGLRPPPSDDLKSAPPERTFALPAPVLEGGSPFDDQPGDRSARESSATATPVPRDSWEGSVTSQTTADDTDETYESPRRHSGSVTSSPLSWRTEPDDLGSDSSDDRDSDIRLSDDRADEETISVSGPSEAEQLEAARKRHVDELQHRWLVTQAQILDDPRDAVREAGLLIGDAMQFVTSTFTDHRDRIEREWKSNDDLSTDELRMIMRRYRNLFQYVLSASQLPDV